MTTLIIYDLETTGLEWETKHIIEIAAVVIKLEDTPSQSKIIIVDEFNKLVDPECEIENSDIHGIDNKVMIVKNAKNFKTTITEFIEWVDKNTDKNNDVILASHNNIMFDQKFLENEFYRAKMKVPKNWHFSDTLIYLRKAIPNEHSHSLPKLYNSLFSKNLKSAHKAIADVKGLCEILNYVYKKELGTPVRDLKNTAIKSAFWQDLCSQDMSYILQIKSDQVILLKNIYGMRTVNDIIAHYNSDTELYTWAKTNLFKTNCNHLANMMMRSIRHYKKMQNKNSFSRL